MPGAPGSPAPLSEHLIRSLRRALSIAAEQHHGAATPEHLLLALTDDPDAAPVMQACDVDLDELRLTVSSALSKQATAADGAAPGPDAGFQAILQRAVVHRQSTGKNREINGAHVLAVILVSVPAEPAADFLRDQGMTRFEALSYISHGLRKGEAIPARDGGGPATGAAMLEVLLLNDDYTPMEFVVAVLERVFEQDRETATRTMLRIHSHGLATCGTYSPDIARAKAAQVLEFARAQGHPLGCVIAAASRYSASPPPPHAESVPGPEPHFSASLELTLHRALACADVRQHEHATLEHLLLALIDDVDASAVMQAAEVDLGVLKETLANFIDDELKTLVTDADRDPSPTPAFQRVVQRAVLHAQHLGRHAVTGADVLLAMLAEPESPAAWLLGEKASSIVPTLERGVEPGTVRESFNHARTKPVVVEKVKRRPSRK
jgi:ATP-dependent Clp protease ATP-binding subunit ClpA